MWHGWPGRVAKFAKTALAPSEGHGSTQHPSARAAFPLLCPCPVALLFMESKYQQDANTGWRELGMNPPEYSWNRAPISSWSVALSSEDSCSLYFSQPCPCCAFPRVLCVQGPMCREVARVTHASHSTLSPCGPGSSPCAGLTEIPFLEAAKEPAFAFSSGECDVMSLLGARWGGTGLRAVPQGWLSLPELQETLLRAASPPGGREGC